MGDIGFVVGGGLIVGVSGLVVGVRGLIIGVSGSVLIVSLLFDISCIDGQHHPPAAYSGPILCQHLAIRFRNQSKGAYSVAHTTPTAQSGFERAVSLGGQGEVPLLRYFVVLAEELHYGRAAARLAITQPPLSNAIKALEKEVGAQLLIRDTRHVELTQAGLAFLEEARQILVRVDQAAQVARVVGSGMRGRLEVGVTGSLIYREVPALVRCFGQEMPEIDLQLPTTVHAARQWLTIVAMVANGLGISLVPGSLARSRVEGVRFVPIAGQDMAAPAMLAWNRAHYPPALASFVDCARRALRSFEQ